MKQATAVALGTLAGLAYFYEGERGIPRESNCSYLSPVSTDIAAWVAGALLIGQGVKHDAPLVTFLGTTVAALHVGQAVAHKVSTRPTRAELAELAGRHYLR